FSSFCHSSSLKAAKPPLGAEDAPTTLTRMSMPPKRELTSLITNHKDAWSYSSDCFFIGLFLRRKLNYRCFHD
ncbi:MAG: hypothetical protein WB443_00570, partial [Nitrososphaeraceae archaeon]